MAKVNWTFQALEDLDEIAEYLASNSTKYANHIVKLIFERVELLGTFPEMGRVVPELNIKSIRELIIKNHRVVYTYSSNKQVDIIAIRHASRPLEELPLQ